MRPFFVTALPRSRTAWTSNWLTGNASLCYHDVPYDPALLVNPRTVGFAGPELITQADDILMDHPEAPWLVLLRSFEHSSAAFQAYLKSIPGAWSVTGESAVTNLFELRKHKLAVLCKHATVHAVDWTALDDEDTARAAWIHLMPDVAFDVARWRLLCKLNVQQQKPNAWPPTEK